MTHPALEFTGIVHRYDAPNVLDGISLLIDFGDVVLLEET